MRIGLDFDNTIANYNLLFPKLAIKNKYISANSKITEKNKLKNFLLKKQDGKKKWMTLQGLAYGKYMKNAEIFSNLVNFLILCKEKKYKIFIISPQKLNLVILTKKEFYYAKKP